MKTIIVLVLSVLLISCCGSRKATAVKEDVKENRTETIKYVVRDTTIMIPGDTVLMKQPIPCPDVVWQGEASSNKTKVTAKIRDGTIEVACAADSLNETIQYLERELERQHNKEKVITKTIEKKYIPKSVYWVGLIELIAALILFRKPLLKLIA